MSEWDAWIGRERSDTFQLTPDISSRWLAAFDRKVPDLQLMPQGIHFAVCTPSAPTNQLGEDGHPKRESTRSSFLPPIPLPRRMWAASEIEFHLPIGVSPLIALQSRVASISEKAGSSGKLAFVNVEHEMRADDRLAVRETQTLVYREAAASDAPLSPPALSSDTKFDPNEWDSHRMITPDPRLLFRYSALTFNTHRIHYDLPYAREVERYRGLVVHGPLTASLLLQLAASELGENTLKRFSFRGVSPAIADEALHLVMRKGDAGPSSSFELGAFAADGRQIVKASASI